MLSTPVSCMPLSALLFSPFPCQLYQDSGRFRGQIEARPQVPAALHKVAQEARQNAWGLYRSPQLPALASQFTVPATGRCPAHTSQNTEMPSTSRCAELPYTPLEWLTCAAPRSHALPRLPSPPDLMGLTTRLQLMVGGWQQWEVCRFPRQTLAADHTLPWNMLEAPAP